MTPWRRAAREPGPGGRGALTVAVVYGAAGALAIAAFAWTQWRGVRDPETALAFGALIALGETLAWHGPPAPRADEDEARREGDAWGVGDAQGRHVSTSAVQGAGAGQDDPRRAGDAEVGHAGAGDPDARRAGDAEVGHAGAGAGGRESGGVGEAYEGPYEPEGWACEPAPVAAAGALGYAVVLRVGGEPATPGVLQAVAVVAAAALVALVPRAVLGRPVGPERAARRVLVVALAALCCQPLRASSLGDGPFLVAYLLLVCALAGLADAALASALTRAREEPGEEPGEKPGEEPRAATAMGVAVRVAVCATAAATGPAVAVAGGWALPVVCAPLLLVQLSFRRCAGIRAACRQTVASLARTTEIAGHTPAGHARQVARLSRAVGRELRLPGPSLTVLEYAALMHDLGQLSLVDPVPTGATEPLPEAERRRIARLGGAVVRRTGVPEEVAEVVERQADPYREQPLPARIVRAVNAYVELVGGSSGGSGGSPQEDRAAAAPRALARLRRRTARDFDPAVVEALARVVSRPVRGRPR
ncbi:HD domain-containing protein [Streptomyces sparsogenes]|uniref:HD domain-containing protein n=1 Tax=Streptomyces sparsogenes TaxID=67365 RepID=UPI00384B72EE